MLKKALLVAMGLMLIVGLTAACSQQSGSGDSPSKPQTGASGLPDWMLTGGSGEVLATVNGSPIYLDDYKDRMEKQSPYIRARYADLEKKKEFLDNMVRFELLAQAAAARGYANDPEVIRSAKQVMTQKLMREEFENKVRREDITDDEMRKYYEEHQSEYNKPAMRRASHILVKVDEAAGPKAEKEARQKALKILKEAKGKEKEPNSFRKLAAKYSNDDSNKNRGGDLGYFASTEDGGPMVKEFSEAVFKMGKINDLTGPVRSKFGFHIIRLTGKRDKIERSFEQVKGQIQHRLFKDKRTKMFDDFIDGLKEKAAIDVKEATLDAYVVPGSKPARPGEEEAEEADAVPAKGN